MTEIRTLRADEIECRVQQVTEKGCIILVYKNARCDMRILDEVYGSNNWQRTHEVINGNLFCNIDIWDDAKKQWVRKQDVGVESNTEKEKGEASDSFKRAGFNIGIGRELYTAPFIWITLSKDEITDYNGKKQLAKGVRFEVKSIGYNSEREINSLVVVDNKGVERFTMSSKATAPITPKKPVESAKTPEQLKVIPEQPKEIPFDKAKVDAELGKMNTKAEMVSYWSKHKEWQTIEEFIGLKDKHKNRIDESKAK